MSWTEAVSGKLHCRLCPHNCIIKENGTGICLVRKNSNSELDLPWYGRLSALNIDPIEKKPLYHFYPGSSILSAGFFGCNFHCPFCQNYQISQKAPATDTYGYISPETLVKSAAEKELPAIAYTYSEPVIHFEYIMEAARLARNVSVKNVLVTNGFLNYEPAAELLSMMDGVNVDLKAFTDNFYRKLGGKLRSVLDFIKLAAEKTHLEVTTLIIPGENDSEQEITGIAEFLASISENIPLHLSCYYPTYKYKIPATSIDSVTVLAEKASRILRFVYPGNVGSKSINTLCTSCGNVLVSRRGYAVSTSGITSGSCSECGNPVPFPVR